MILATPEVFSCVFGTCSLPTPRLKPQQHSLAAVPGSLGQLLLLRILTACPVAATLWRWSGSGRLNGGDVWSSGERLPSDWKGTFFSPPIKKVYTPFGLFKDKKEGTVDS